MSGLYIVLFSNSVYAQEVEDILSIEAYNRLQTIPDTFLIDVRTRAEYQFVGHWEHAYLFPYMFLTSKPAKAGEGYEYLFNQPNEAFIEEISKVFNKKDNLIIICRDGTRSASAAKELAENGFENVFNVKHGFEGEEFPYFENPDLNRLYKNMARQNKVTGFIPRRHYGWKWWGLPWTYKMDPIYLYPPDLRKNISNQ